MGRDKPDHESEEPMATGTATTTNVRTGWVVRNRSGQVVVIFEGHGARTAADEWAKMHHCSVDPVELD
jgi:hypothetical protein